MTTIKSIQTNRLRRPHAPTVIQPMPTAITPMHALFARPRGLLVRGLTDQFGAPHAEIGNQKTELLIPLADFLSTAARLALQAHNFILTKAEWDDLKADVDRLSAFPPRSLAKRPGWTMGSFVSPDGNVIAPAGSEPAVPLFEPRSTKDLEAGTLDVWKREGAALIEKATLPTFAVMVPFVPPVLDIVGTVGNYVVEFEGSDRGKLDILQQLAASVVGRPNGTSLDRYAISGTSLPTELPTLLGQHSDLPLIITDVDLYAANATKRARGAKFDELLVGLVNGTMTGKRRAQQAEPARFVSLITTTEAISNILASLRPIANDRATEHVFTVRVGGRSKRATSLASRVQSLTSAQHGTPMTHFLRVLVKGRSKNEAALRSRLVRWMTEFRMRVVPATSDPATDRAIVAFGLVYAAGRLAKAYGALPKSLNCMKATVACYDANRTKTAGQAPFLERLRALAANPKTLRVDPNNLQHFTDSELAKFPAILRADRRGNDELLLTPAALLRAFPNKNLMLRDPSLKGIINHDKGRVTVKRRLRLGKTSDRVVWFMLP